ncbi:unnamed protein product [Enterobius vermicularis]|uniref:CsbD family protein n=1 Tax=Enterobius vermicularis TaxID=51028 RepID=A0A0N4VNR8_ENTVE|nr:unnamed protein product [Enterobius vermicularis]
MFYRPSRVLFCWWVDVSGNKNERNSRRSFEEERDWEAKEWRGTGGERQKDLELGREEKESIAGTAQDVLGSVQKFSDGS